MAQPESSVGTNNGNGLSSDQKIGRMLSQTPSTPSFEQSTIRYCDGALKAAGVKFGEVLTREFPEMAGLVDQRLDLLKSPKPNSLAHLPHHDFIEQDGRIMLEVPSDKSPNPKLFLNRVSEAVYNANPNLGLFHYLIGTYPAKDTRYARERHPWFTNRLVKVMEVGELAFDSPIVEIMGVGYVTQVAKAYAVDKSRALLRKAQTFGGLDTPERVTEFLDRIDSSVGQIRMDQRYIATGLATIDTIAEDSDFSEEQVQTILDLAFIRNRGFDQPVEFSQVLAPLIRMVALGDWEQAFIHRDFLLRYFSSSFPAWRAMSFHTAAGVPSFDSFKDLAKAVVGHRLVIDDIDVPDQYRQVIGDIFPKKIERAQKEKDKAILAVTVGLSNTLVKEIAAAYRGSKSAREQIREIFREQTEYITDLLSSIPKDKSEKQMNFDLFYGVLISIKPHWFLEEIKNLYKELKRVLKEDSLQSTIQSGFTIYTPSKIKVLSVELDQGKQCYFYQTGETFTRNTKGGLAVSMKNSRNFGRLLYRIVQASLNRTSESRLLTPSQFADVLKRAFENERVKNSVINSITLNEYLLALLNSTNLPSGLAEEDPVIQFINQL